MQTGRASIGHSRARARCRAVAGHGRVLASRLPSPKMATEPATSFRSLSYPQARLLALAGGVLIVGALAGIMWARRVEPVEIMAVLLFLPVFGALLVWDAAGGAAAGVIAAVVYVAV